MGHALRRRISPHLDRGPHRGPPRWRRDALPGGDLEEELCRDVPRPLSGTVLDTTCRLGHHAERRTPSVAFFGLSTWVLGLVLAGIMFGATVAGLLVGRAIAARSEHLREPIGVLQGALVGFMGLVLAFGLSLAVGRYESRRADVVNEANAIGTTYLRAQTLAEPVRTESLALLRRYTDISITLSDAVPGGPVATAAVAESGRLENELWALAGQSLVSAPVDSAPRLYVETLNEMFDAQSDRVYGLTNRVPTAVLV